MSSLSLSFVIVFLAGGFAIRPGPQVKPTTGSPWPMPALINQTDTYLILRHGSFTFQTNLVGCDILDKATARYHKIVTQVGKSKNWTTPGGQWKDSNYGGVLDRLDIFVQNPCETYPYLGMNESYELSVNGNEAVLNSVSVWGGLRGLETFSQLVVKHKDTLTIKESLVRDEPRFTHRGFMLDTSRHYMPVWVILKMLTAMECNKLNVFHWHIVDDQSFPYKSTVYPSLSENGAYNNGGYVYTVEDIKVIVEFARLRGIRVVPEFDTPGHTRSWGEGIPSLLTKCYSRDRPNGEFGPINPTDENNYQILKNLLAEIVALFPDRYIHLGGDEVDNTCWLSNPQIIDYMKDHNMTHFSELEDLHMKRMLDITSGLNASSMVWQEVFTRGVQLPKSTIVQVWLGSPSALLKMVTSAGYPALLSSCWYLDHFEQSLYAGGGDWKKFYKCEPLAFSASDEQKRLVLGGETCMWAEYVDETNVLQRVWPRASAASEKLWSPEGGDIIAAAARLEEHVCRMRRRGIPAQPANGPSFCT